MTRPKDRYEKLRELNEPEASEQFFGGGNDAWVQSADGSWVRAGDKAARKGGGRKAKAGNETEAPPVAAPVSAPPAEPKRRLFGRKSASDVEAERKAAREQRAREAERERLADLARREEEERREEHQRRAQIDRQTELAVQAERQRQAELEQQAERERARAAELERKAEQERARVAELEREVERERARVAEVERAKTAELERERARLAELDRQRMSDLERERARVAELERIADEEIRRREKKSKSSGRGTSAPERSPEPWSTDPATTAPGISPWSEREPSTASSATSSSTSGSGGSSWVDQAWASTAWDGNPADEPQRSRERVEFVPAQPAAQPKRAAREPKRRPPATGRRQQSVGARMVTYATATGLVLAALGIGAAINLLQPAAGGNQRPFSTSGKISESLDARIFTVTVEKASAAKILQNGGSTHESQGAWVIVRVRLMAKTEPANVAYAALRDADGKTYLATDRMAQPLLDGRRTFQPGIPIEGDVVFEVPKDKLAGLTALFAPHPEKLQLDTMAEVELPELSMADEKAAATVGPTEVKL